MDRNVVICIMAGGAGTRFWPVSTERRPKQFLQIFGPRSLLQQAFDRALRLVPQDRILVLTHHEFCGLVREQLPQLPEANVIGEPCRRDTAAAVVLAGLLCRKRYGNPVIGVLTADHVLSPEEEFAKAFASAASQARKSEALYTFGIRPEYPATGYGYLQFGDKILEDHGIEHFKLVRFKEKPCPEIAKEYCDSGVFLWNSGMFVWTSDAILREASHHIPHHVAALSATVEMDGTAGWQKALDRGFADLPCVSVDFAIMEKAKDVRCVAANFSWEDLGGWLSVEKYLPDRDAAGNAYRGQLTCIDSQENLIYSEDRDEEIALIGVDHLVVIRAGRRTLIVPKDRAEHIKRLVEERKKNGHSQD